MNDGWCLPFDEFDIEDVWEEWVLQGETHGFHTDKISDYTHSSSAKCWIELDEGVAINAGCMGKYIIKVLHHLKANDETWVGSQQSALNEI